MPFERAPSGCWAKLICKDGSYFFAKEGTVTCCGKSVMPLNNHVLVRNPEPHDIELRVRLEYKWTGQQRKWHKVYNYSVVLFAKESKHLQVPHFDHPAQKRKLVLSYDDMNHVCTFQYYNKC